ncbi:annexin A9 [Ambystoma mexicanum]|uniref:annexin A9 n=1 Tax=Ambystoma mexicanum TaxID=8296 RepID=UPI0037E8036E
MSLVQEILSHLSVADKVAAWGTLGTIKPHPCFEADIDVEDLAEAMAEKSVHKDIIVDIVVGRSNAQRLQIVNLFKHLVNEDLIQALEAALSGSLKDVIVALLRSPAQYDARELKGAMKGIGTDEDRLTEILATRTNQQLQEIRTIYKEDFKSTLENDIAAETSGDFKDLLLALLKGTREKHSGVIDYVQIDSDAQVLYEVTKKNNRSTSQWISILSLRSLDHLNRVFEQFKMYSSSEVEETIQKYFKGDFQKGLLTLVSVIKNTPQYFAEKLYKSMKGMGTNENTLTRIMVSRSEIDLLSIRAEFRKKYGKSLYSFLQASITGDYLTALLSLCRAEDL